jgi:hypothetical protein
MEWMKWLIFWPGALVALFLEWLSDKYDINVIPAKTTTQAIFWGAGIVIGISLLFWVAAIAVVLKVH